jgi:DNA polymerase (family 10)
MKFSKLIAIVIANAAKFSNPFEAAAYRAAAKKMQPLSNEIATDAKIKELNLTENMKNHLRDLKKNYREDGKELEIGEIMQLPGIGEVNAKKLFDMGFRMKNRKAKKWRKVLPRVTQLAIELNPGPIHRDVVEKYKKALTGRNIILTGSFRRGKTLLKDIDLLIVSNCASAIVKYVEKLGQKFPVKIISMGDRKASVFIRLGKNWHHMDIFRADKEDKIPALIHSTGPGSLNVRMRRKAKKMGYKLSEKGLFHLSSGKKKSFITEKEYYKFLGEEMGERF